MNSVEAHYSAPEERRDSKESFGRRPITRNYTSSEAQIRHRNDITVMLYPPSRHIDRHDSPESPEA